MRFVIFCLLLLFVQSLGVAQSKLIPYLKGTMWGYADAKKQLKIPAQYNYAEPFKDGYAIVNEGEKYGFIDETGKLLNNTWYKYAEAFSEGLAKVQNEAGFYGYIDSKGAMVIDFQYKNASSFAEGRAQVGDYGATYVIDKKGTKLSNSYDFIGRYRNGMAAYSLGSDQWSFLNLEGQPVGEDYYYEVGEFGAEGLAAVKSGDGDQKVGFIDKTGKLVIPIQYDNAWIPYFSEGLAPARKDEKYGFIDTKGNWVIQPEYDYAVGFSEGLSCVFNGGYCGFIDKKGKLVVPLKYRASIEGDFNFSFHNGLAAIFDPEKGKMGFIDKKGKVKLPFAYNYSGQYVRFDANGLALVPTPENYMISGYIDKKGTKYWEGIAPAPVEEEEPTEEGGE